MKVNVGEKIENSALFSEIDFLKRLLKNRGIEDVEGFLNVSRKNLQNPENLDNIDAGANLLIEVLNRGGRIWTVADSDVDGQTSFAILYNYIKKVWPAADITWEIHSHKQHGLEDFIEELEDTNEFYDLVLIADAGSNDKEYWDRLGVIGSKGLCLDHHLLDNEISENCILINNQTSKYYLNKEL